MDNKYYNLTAACLLLPLMVCCNAFAEWGASGSCTVDYDHTPIVDWKNCENGTGGGMESTFHNDCADMNGRLKSHVTCKFDKKSFDDHYKADMADPTKKANTRDNANPGSHCTEFFQGLRDNFTNIGRFLAEAKPAAEFRSKVKTLTCQYAGNDETAPKIVLNKKNGNLTIMLGKLDHPGGLDWMIRDFKTIFPAFQKTWDDHH